MHEVTVDDTSPLRAPVRGEFFEDFFFPDIILPDTLPDCVRVCMC